MPDFSFVFDMLFGWVGVAGLVIIACLVLAFIFPQFRVYALAVAAGIAGIASVYGKGQRDRAALERRRRDEAVAKVNKDYDEIERRPDTVDHVKGRLTKGDF